MARYRVTIETKDDDGDEESCVTFAMDDLGSAVMFAIEGGNSGLTMNVLADALVEYTEFNHDSYDRTPITLALVNAAHAYIADRMNRQGGALAAIYQGEGRT